MTAQTDRFKIGFNSILFTGIVLACLLLVNVFAASYHGRADLTEDGLWTLSKVSKKLVKNLKSDLKVRLFVSRKLVTGLNDVRQYIIDMLGQYADASNGRFKWEVVHPGDSDAAKELTEKYRIPKVDARTRQSGAKESREIYFGFAITYKRPGAPKEEVEVIPVIAPNMKQNLEYMLTERIHRLVKGRKKILLVTGHQEVDAKQVKNHIKQLNMLFAAYDVVQYDLRGNKPPPDDARVMLVTTPKTPWNAQDRRKLDQFVMGGNGVLFLVEGMAIQKQRQQFMQNQRMPKIWMAARHGINELLKNWGVEIDGNFVLDEGQRPLLIRRGRQAQVVFHPALLTLRVSRRLKAPVTPVLASSLKLTRAYLGKKIQPGKKFRVQPLMVTSPKAWTVTGPYVFNPQRRDRPPENAKRGAYVVGAVVEGILPSAFVRPGQEKGNQLSESASKARLAVIGDFDILRLAGYIPGNRILLQNLMDWIAQDETLVRLRNKQMQERDLDLPESKSSRILIQLANILILPLLLALFGVLRWRWRMARGKDAYRQITD